MEWTLGRFYEFFDDENPREISKKDLIRYYSYITQEYKKEDGNLYSLITVGNIIVRLRRYFKFLTLMGYYLINPSSVLIPPKKSKNLPKNIPQDKSIQTTINSIMSPTAYVQLRDKVMYELLYSTGIRSNEILCLNVSDVNLEEGRLRVREGKGKKDRYLPLGTKSTKAMSAYLVHGRPFFKHSNESNALFLGLDSTRLTYSGFSKMVSKYGKRHTISAHKIRHACAIEMLKNGADIRYIQELLGHSNLSSTQIYTQILPLDLKRAHKKHHPRTRLPKTKKRSI